MGIVKAVCVSDRRGIQKENVESARFKEDYGIATDAHAGNWHRQVSLLADESVELMRQRFPDIPTGAFAENILTRGIALSTLPVGTKLRVGQVLLQVTQIGKECHADCAIRRQVGDCVMPREGIFTMVLEDGCIHPGDEITIEE